MRGKNWLNSPSTISIGQDCFSIKITTYKTVSKYANISASAENVEFDRWNHGFTFKPFQGSILQTYRAFKIRIVHLFLK